MANKNSPAANPVTFELPLPLVEKIEATLTSNGARSVSEVIRCALEEFDYSQFQADRAEHRQISVRLPQGIKKTLLRQARLKRVSAGEILRAAIEALPAGRQRNARD
ncbi:MAG: ribbon-helix-helix protein, CopG family [Opitutaceae bacterium]|nr:ribbon-helix-helix protein, CopG family [Opitutaceae bacterium]